MIDLNTSEYELKDFAMTQNILKYIDDYNIFKFYIESMGKEFTTNVCINSPLRKDNHPSFGIFYSEEDNKFIFNDFARKNCSGDVFMFVQRMFPELSYNQILSKICVDFGLEDKIKCDTNVPKTKVKDFEYNKNPNLSKRLKKIGVKYRKFLRHDILYWEKFGITLKTLKKYNVYPITHIFKEFFDGYSSIVKADLHAYVYIECKDNIITHEVYQPFNTKGMKFIKTHNKGVHDGYSNLPKKGELLLITKSRKDVMSIHDTINIPSIGIQSESILIKDTVIEEYKSRFRHNLTLFDNDVTGINLALSYQDKYNIPGITIPRVKPGVTDYADLVKELGQSEARHILLNLIRPHYGR